MGIINKLRKSSIILFCLSFIALIGTLLLHNLLVSFKFSNSEYPFYLKPGTNIYCDETNDYCNNILVKKVYARSLENCNKIQTHVGVFYNEQLLGIDEFLNLNISKSERAKSSKSKNFYVKVIKTGKKDEGYKNLSCIKNSDLFETYKKFPIVFDLIADIRENPKYTAGTSDKVNPYFYGETSISNIAKRFPQNYIFKSLLYISSIIMFLYWNYNNKTFKYLTNNSKRNLFLIFGYSSAVFLFLHVLLLGQTFELKFFKTLKRIVIVLFILSEILAQFYLVRAIKNNLNLYYQYINEKVLNLKIFLIYSVILISILILSILIFRDLTKEFDYILEWNYFTVLLFYYLLSFFMWKKKI